MMGSPTSSRTSRRRWTRTPGSPVFRAMSGLSLAHLGRHDEAMALLDTYSQENFAMVPRDVLWLATIGGSAELVALVDSPRRAEMLRPLLEPYRGMMLVIAGGARSRMALSTGSGPCSPPWWVRPWRARRSATRSNSNRGSGRRRWRARSRWWRARLLGDPGGTDAEAVAPTAGENGLPALARHSALLDA